jgi:hypothetical protein
VTLETPWTHQSLMTMTTTTTMMMMMMTEMVFKTLVQYEHLTRLIAREDYIKFSRRESSKTYYYYYYYYYYYCCLFSLSTQSGNFWIHPRKRLPAVNTLADNNSSRHPLPQYAFMAWCSVRGEHRNTVGWHVSISTPRNTARRVMASTG